MPLPTPNITLTATLQDYQGNAIGSGPNPAYLRIALAGFGQTLPRIPQSGGGVMIGQVASWPGDIPYLGGTLTVHLWGNDQISPAGTYYMIAILDSNRNCVQSGIYQFTGGPLTVDLANAAQIVQPSPQLAGMQRYTIKATGPGTTITLPSSPIPGTPVLVYRSGILLSTVAGDITIVGTLITFTTGYVLGDVLDVVYFTSTF